ncbi:hypothetical protein BLNAU_10012 [Blattamonas nauphoetae]|uniref:Uncharacterized protein n=1 Tax=Blattamonas nauphoetae TaxID=2049346 RepID=A0ABQ9XUD9_9EUKA|nr:hypothetical protein BLNAU_10012 [Blattamonas nauphoetae]
MSEGDNYQAGGYQTAAPAQLDNQTNPFEGVSQSAQQYEGGVGSSHVTNSQPSESWVRRALLNKFSLASLKTASFWGWILLLLGVLAYFIGSIIAWAVHSQWWWVPVPFLCFFFSVYTVLVELQILTPYQFGNTEFAQLCFSLLLRGILYIIAAIPGFWVPPIIAGSGLTLCGGLLYIAGSFLGESFYTEKKFAGFM